MSGESIELYKPYTPAKMQWPAMLQRKLDGVPVRIRNIGGHRAAWTRQNEVVTSIPHIFIHIRHILEIPGSSITGELYIEGVPFKTISGLARKKIPTAECGNLVFHIFDADLNNAPAQPYAARMAAARLAWEDYAKSMDAAPDAFPVRFCPGIQVDGPDAAEHGFNLLMQACPKAEGAVLHSLGKPYQPGKRHWLTQKMKPRASIDLRVTGFERAMSKTGEPLDMVGRINCEFTGYIDHEQKTVEIGVGPGALTHKERRAIYSNPDKYIGRIAQVGYMPDDTYNALREPTFERWRDDKSEPNTERGA